MWVILLFTIMWVILLLAFGNNIVYNNVGYIIVGIW